MKNPEQIATTKSSGDEVIFNTEKLKHSLEKSYASKVVIQEIINKIKASLHDEVTTKEIYKTAFDLLRKNSRPTAARYKLKKAIVELVPTDFPFEKFVAAILNYEGFKTNVGVIAKGFCVNHELCNVHS